MNLKLTQSHWFLVATSAASAGVAWAMNSLANGTLTLPAAAVSGLSLLSLVLGILTKSALTPPPPPGSP